MSDWRMPNVPAWIGGLRSRLDDLRDRPAIPSRDHVHFHDHGRKGRHAHRHNHGQSVEHAHSNLESPPHE